MQIHEAVLKAVEQAPQPLRNASGLDSALSKPKNAAYYEQADIIAQAAILCVAISQAQAFLDGNKRTAFAVTNVFLMTNNYVLPMHIDEMEVVSWLDNIAKRIDDREEATKEFEDWLRNIVIQLP